MNRRLLLVLVLAFCGVVFAGWRWFAARTAPPVAWQGYAEANFVKIGPTQQGLLTAVHVVRGDKVSAQAPLFDQDATGDLAARDQAQHLLTQAQQQLANLQSAMRPAEIAQAQANLAADQAAHDKLSADLSRNESLLKTGSAAVQLVDQQRADLRTAEARIEGDQAALAQTQAPMGRDREITAQQAAVQAAQSALQMLQWRLDQRRVVAPVAGTIADVMAEPGETIDAGMPVVSLLPPENIFLRFFVPETALATIHLGDSVSIVCDNCPKTLEAKISFVAPQAEYTPPVIYSEANRAKLVYMVEAHPAAQQAELINPGQPVTVLPIAKAGRS